MDRPGNRLEKGNKTKPNSQEVKGKQDTLAGLETRGPRMMKASEPRTPKSKWVGEGGFQRNQKSKVNEPESGAQFGQLGGSRRVKT